MADEDKSICDKEPCISALRALGTAKDEYNIAWQEFMNAAAALGFTGSATVAVLIAWAVEKIASRAIPVVGWILGGIDALLLARLAWSYYKFTGARDNLNAAKERVRSDCPSGCWPDNVLREM